MNDKLTGQGITFDDVLLQPRYSEVVPSEVGVSTLLTRRIPLNIPLVSSPMDTVTEHEMAIALAKEGGLGIIHKNMSIEAQVREVIKVKRSANGVITDPVTLPPDAPLAGNPRIIARLVEETVRDNFRVEEEIEREVERTLVTLGGTAAGMDKQKLISGLRERIAKKRGFVL